MCVHGLRGLGPRRALLLPESANKRRKACFPMECDICRTLAQQLRSYEMEIDHALNGPSQGASVAPGSSLDNALEESRKTKLLYQHHRAKFHRPAAIQPDLVPCDMEPKAEQSMNATPFWPDDLSVLSNQTVLNYMAENRAWNKQLREGTVALVNTRLAKTITQEEYVLSRKRSNEDTAECWRRSGMLVRDLAIRERGATPFLDSKELPN